MPELTEVGPARLCPCGALASLLPRAAVELDLSRIELEDPVAGAVLLAEVELGTIDVVFDERPVCGPCAAFLEPAAAVADQDWHEVMAAVLESGPLLAGPFWHGRRAWSWWPIGLSP